MQTVTPETSVFAIAIIVFAALVLDSSERPAAWTVVAAAALWFFQAPSGSASQWSVLAVIFNIRRPRRILSPRG